MDYLLHKDWKETEELQQLALIILPIPILKHYTEAFRDTYW